MFFPGSDPHQTRRPRALVTGATGGIGAAIAASLVGAGWDVWITSRTSGANTRPPEGCGDCRMLALDLDDPESAARMAAAFEHGLGPDRGGLDVLVHAAGYVQPGLLEWITPGELRRQLEVNTVGAHAVTRALLPALKTRRGRIVWISSVSGRISLPGIGAYAASKFALEALADAWRIELATEGVGLTLIEPGPVATPIWDKADRAIAAFAGSASPRVRTAMSQALRTSESRAIPAGDVARAVLRVLAERRPPARVLLGRGAWAVPLLRILPDGLRDFLVRRGFESRVRCGENPESHPNRT